MKCATLVSRCSEKDLFDLCWLFGHMPTMNIDTMIRYGKAIDGGVNAEMILHSLISNVPMKASCGFGLQQSASEILQQIEIFRNALIQEVKDRGLTKENVLYIGNDLNDLNCMNWAGVSVAPNDSVQEILDIAHITTFKNGGHGAFREVAEMVCKKI